RAACTSSSRATPCIPTRCRTWAWSTGARAAAMTPVRPGPRPSRSPGRPSSGGPRARGSSCSGASPPEAVAPSGPAPAPRRRRDAAEGAAAAQYLRQALEIGEELEMRLLQARCHLGLGKLLEDERHLATGIAMFSEMGVEAGAGALSPDAGAPVLPARECAAPAPPRTQSRETR